jgi:hypothetical protein
MNFKIPPVLFFLAAPLSAQTVGGGFDTLLSTHGDASNSGFGAVVTGAGDVNADGFDDFAVSELNHGVVRVFSGIDGTTLHEWSNPLPNNFFGSSLSDVGDVNQDGYADLLVGADGMDSGSMINAGKAILFSGVDGSILYEWTGTMNYERLGYPVSGAGDLNQDGYPDLLVGATGATVGGIPHAGAVNAYSGADGSLLFQCNRPNLDGPFGVAVSDAGDVNNDGFPDVVIGSDQVDFGIHTGLGHVSIFSGADGSLIREWYGMEPEAFLGHSVADLGDINQDGHADLLVGAFGADNGGRKKTGKAFAYSGADGSLIFEWAGVKGWKSFGWSVSNAGDINMDGINDALIGDCVGALPNSLFLYSGADGSLIHTQAGSDSYYDNFAQMVSDAGDTNGDGHPDIIASASGSSEFGLNAGGAAHVIGYSPFIRASGGEISISAGGRVDYEFDFPAEMAHQGYKLLASASGNGPTFIGVDVPLTYDPTMQKTWDGSYPGTVEGRWHGTLNQNAQGHAVMQLQPGVRPYLIGVSLQLAVVAVHPNGPAIFSSTAVPLIFLP